MAADAPAAELGAFLMARRQEIDPADLGLPETGRRRVKGLRREEVAQHAAISTDYYARIEQGRRPVSESVLDAIAEVLRLTTQQRAYVFNLARSAAVKTDPRTRRSTKRQSVSATVQALIDAMSTAPAVVQNRCFDIVATNALGRALFAPVIEGSTRPNMARFAFLEPSAPDFFDD
jgi:transcriptional regulator with XRE-family HTH domain